MFNYQVHRKGDKHSNRQFIKSRFKHQSTVIDIAVTTKKIVKTDYKALMWEVKMGWNKLMIVNERKSRNGLLITSL